MFRRRRIAPALVERTLAVTVALALHAAVLIVAAAMVYRQPRPQRRPVWNGGPIRFYITPSRTEATTGTALGTPEGRKTAPHQHAKPVAIEATVIPGAETVIVDEGPNAQTVHPDLPAMVIDVAPRAKSPRSAFGEEAPLGRPDGDPNLQPGDSGRRGPPIDRARWYELGIGGGLATQPRPSRFCVPRSPAMPQAARLIGVAGPVDAIYVVDADGVVRAVAAEGHPLLASAVEDWLRGCLFEPSVQNGHATPARVAQHFVFKFQ